MSIQLHVAFDKYREDLGTRSAAAVDGQHLTVPFNEWSLLFYMYPECSTRGSTLMAPCKLHAIFFP